MIRSLALIPALLTVAAKAWAGPCAATTYDIYKANGFTCTVGPLTFSSFTSQYTNAHDLSNAAIGDAEVSVTVINNAGTYTYGLNFALGSGMAVRDDGSGAQTGTAAFTYDVGGAPIAMASIRLAGTRDGTGTNATLSKTVGGETLDASAAAQTLTASAALTGSPNNVSVSETATVTIPGGALQQAQIQSIEDTFVVVPEPAAGVCLLLGMVGMALRARANRQKQRRYRT